MILALPVDLYDSLTYIATRNISEWVKDGVRLGFVISTTTPETLPSRRKQCSSRSLRPPLAKMLTSLFTRLRVLSRTTSFLSRPLRRIFENACLSFR